VVILLQLGKPALDVGRAMVSHLIHNAGEATEKRCLSVRSTELISPPIGGDFPRYGDPRLIQPRLGQGVFRVVVTDAYDRACAVTEEHSLPALEAAHIRPYAEEGPHDVRNGLLIRVDLHRLFDAGYVTVTPDFRLEVSNPLKTDYRNGRSYYPYHGKELRLPSIARARISTMAQRPHVS
jgi:predicted restriction endonuclease